MNSFQELALPPLLQSALAKLEFHTPTPIQQASIPIILEGHDLVGCAQTGTGKTAAYLLPLLVKLLNDPGSRCLVLVPTRELAYQVSGNLGELAQDLPDLRQAVLIGGTSMIPQLRNLARNPRVIIATPGRLNDHLRKKSVSLETVRYFVLDEADRMLDLGFAPQIAQIATFVPRERQTLLFSATLPPHIRDLARTLLRNPKDVAVDAVSSAPVLIDQSAIEVASPHKAQLLVKTLSSHAGSALVFVRTKARADRVGRYLESQGVDVGVIHGDRSMAQRKRALDGFRDESVRVLVATDIAARGIDIDHVALVINFDLTQVPEDYVHRIGRTGRAGRQGKSITFVSPEEKPMWRDIEALLGARVASQRDPSLDRNIEQPPKIVNPISVRNPHPKPEFGQPRREAGRSAPNDKKREKRRFGDSHEARVKANSQRGSRPHRSR